MDEPPTAGDVIRAIPYGSQPLPGLITAGQLPRESLSALEAAGYRTVIDLRGPGEARGYDEPAAVRAAGLEYVALPVVGHVVDDATFDRVRALLKEAAHHPVVLHCASANRVGAVLLPYLVLDEHRAADEAVRAASRVGLRSPDLLEQAMNYVTRHAAATDAH